MQSVEKRWKSCPRGFLQHVLVGLHSLFIHPNPCVAHRYFLEDKGIAWRLLQREPERRQCVMELFIVEKLLGLVVIIDRLPFSATK